MAQGIPVPASEPEVTPFHYTFFNQDWLPVVLGSLVDLYDQKAWESPPSDIKAQIDTLLEMIAEAYIPLVQQFPQSFEHIHRASVALNGNPIKFINSSTMGFNGYWSQDAPAINDEFGFHALLREGKYNFHAVGLRNSNMGIQTWKLNGTTFGTMDWYGTVLVDHEIVISNFHVPANGDYFVDCQILSKNASSSGYRAGLTIMWFEYVGTWP